jgi:hypothetical protein
MSSIVHKRDGTVKVGDSVQLSRAKRAIWKEGNMEGEG